jgi:hypothetical protein
MMALLAAVTLAVVATGPLQEPLAGWIPSGPPELFRGAELYGHINGGSELYLELGFEVLQVQELSRGEARLEVELYRMADPVAALGVYLSRCGRETPDPRLHDRHTAGRHQLLLLRERFLVVVNNPSGTPALVAALPEVAQALAERLPPASALEVLTPLPTAGRIAGSERVVRGPVGLSALFTLGDGNVLQLGGRVTAVAAGFGESAPDGPYTLVLADYPDEAAARQAFVHAVSHLDPSLQVLLRDDLRLGFRDYAGRFGLVVVDGRRLTLRCNLPKAPA